MENQNEQHISSYPPPAPVLNSLLCASELLGKTWRAYKSRIWVFIGIMSIPFIFSFLISLLFFIPSLAIVLRQIEEAIIYSRFSLTFPTVLLFLSVIVISAVINVWAQVSLLYAIKERGNKIGIKEAFKKGWHKIVSYWWVSLLAGFITFGAFLLFIVPGIIFSIWFSFALYIMIAEDLKGMDALLRSKQLVDGNWWGVFGRFLILGLIMIGVSLLLAPLVFILSRAIGSDYDSISNFFTSIFLSPFITIFSFLIYEDLKRIKGAALAKAPEAGEKMKYILIGMLGIFLPIIILALIFFRR